MSETNIQCLGSQVVRNKLTNQFSSLSLIALKVFCDFHGHSRKKNVFMYGCSTAATIAASSSSQSGDVDSDLVDSVRERVAELSGSDSTSSMDPSDLDEDPGYRVTELILA